MQQLSINTIRTLAMDAVEAAASGHPGTPMALAPAAYVVWQELLRFDPEQPHWPGRDRFVLSCGHASMLLYAVLHLAGVQQLDANGNSTGELAVTLDQIKRFRQLHSRTPGHPESRETTGVEATTGPLGQGLGNSVGMAIAQRWLKAHFGRRGFEDLFDYRIVVFASDGDLMEGVGCEASSLAGHLRLANLTVLYDDNRITIEGETKLAFSEDVARRFEGLGWRVLRVADANNLDEIRAALLSLQDSGGRPTLIIVRSHIAYGAPHKQDTHEAHGAPLGKDEVRATKRVYGWPEDAQFLVPPEVVEHFRGGVGRRGAAASGVWRTKFAQYRNAFPDLARQWDLLQAGRLPDGWDADIPSFPADAKGVATRSASGKVLNAIAKRVPWLLGGSADLAPSNNTLLSGETSFSAENHAGRNLHFGVREHGMAAALNGMALSKLRPYGGTFLVFSDYLRPSLRLAALMRLPSLLIFTHDSIGLGEDGPTHQPIEHLSALRAIPHLVVLRPCDANEVAAAYRTLMTIQDRPVALVLTRQALPTLDRRRYAPAENLVRGAYVLADAGTPQVVLLSSGSEVSLCVAAQEKLSAEGIGSRVVSVPSMELFDEQDQAYKSAVLPPALAARVAVEAGVRQSWDRYLGLAGRFVGLRTFGASAPYKDVYQHFGLTVENVVAEAKQAIGRP
ncbi:MAG: transketolase [Planctomycetia bacterium]|nr:transketolase [Planctomycetia bacterium]